MDERAALIMFYIFNVDGGWDLRVLAYIQPRYDPSSDNYLAVGVCGVEMVRW